MGYKNYKQKDAKWKGNYYSGGTISAQGCGPTSIADAVIRQRNGLRQQLSEL